MHFSASLCLDYVNLKPLISFAAALKVYEPFDLSYIDHKMCSSNLLQLIPHSYMFDVLAQDLQCMCKTWNKLSL